jgi:two-component system, LytTR family, sensor kinase
MIGLAQTVYFTGLAIHCMNPPPPAPVPWRRVTAMSETRTGLRSTRWRWIAAIWCAGGLFDASQNVLIMHKEGKHHSWLPLFGTELAVWLPWALATPFISRLARRYTIVRGATVKTVAIHVAAFSTLTVVTEAWSALLQVLFNPWANRRRPEFLDTWSTSLLYQALTFLIVYALIVTVTLVLDSRERMSRQIAETARLNEELSRAQLAALRRQIEPHFMFNTLNAIAGLVRDHRNNAAVSMVVGLSEFLRRASEDSHRSQVTLAEEVEYLQRYLDIQKVRFGERLQVKVDIPAELLRAQVPNLLLQPLVENAIKHGIAKRVAGGAVRVAAACHNGNLYLSVYNDGPHLPTDWQVRHTGVGLGNLRTRLRILHGNHSELQLRRLDAGGVEVTVTLPLKEA